MMMSVIYDVETWLPPNINDVNGARLGSLFYRLDIYY
jgi:hypothetical protein